MNTKIFLNAMHVYNWILFIWALLLMFFVVVPLAFVAGFTWGLATFSNPLNNAVFMLEFVRKELERL